MFHINLAKTLGKSKEMGARFLKMRFHENDKTKTALS